MRITLAQLEALVWVARLGTVQEAARHLNLAQPTVSLRLRDLSDALGKPMLYRDGRNIKLSADAMNILDYASRILEEVEKIIGESKSGKLSGLVRLGMSEAVALAGLPSLLASLAKQHPDIRLDATIDTSVNLQSDLYARKLDLAIGVNFHENDRIRVTPLGNQKSAWIASPRHRLPPVITPTDIAHFPILTNPNPTPMYQQTMNWFHSARMQPQKVTISYSINVIAQLVKVGIGLAILPVNLVKTDIGNGELIELKCVPALERTEMSLAYRISDWRPVTGAVMEATTDMLERLKWLDG